ncbi:bcl-2/adenovirus E1B 19 kDa-interacting protein 2-like protein isoform X2 [Dromaius novaehollandiae]|uniref:bcl-2/adenovirus E1B 19 kDa-interacting protein 2-like protein isoform X2 n=1 Tax=Dromaius novaehollandiae TaxID=8790 RepID=UPI00311FE939
MAAVMGTAGVQALELSEEWQDEDFPGPLPEEAAQGPPRPMRRRLPAPELSLALERPEDAERSPDASLDLDLDALETPSGSEPEGPDASDWEGRAGARTPGPSRGRGRGREPGRLGPPPVWRCWLLPQLGGGCGCPGAWAVPCVGVPGRLGSPQSRGGGRGARTPGSLPCHLANWAPADERDLAEGLRPAGPWRVLDLEDEGGRRWRLFLGERLEQKVDLSAVEPYTRVLSHGGYHDEDLSAILLFAACHLPDSSIPQYDYVMEQLLRYIAGTLEVTAAERYVLVCLSGAAARGQIPPFGWMKQCYRAVERRLRKSLQAVVIVHPSWYIKALVTLSRPFLSPTFSGKVRFAASLRELSRLVPLEPALVPEPVRRLEPSWDGRRDVPR